MSKNDSNIVVHNHIEGLPQIQSLAMVLVVIGVVIILLLLLALLTLLIWVCKDNKKNPTQVSGPHIALETIKEVPVERLPSREDLTQSAAISNSAYIDDDETDINSNSQHLPMSAINSKLNVHYGNSPDSMASAFGCLFPSNQNGEIIPQNKPKFRTFGGQIFAATKLKSTVTKPELKASRSTRKTSSGREPRTSSLEWDYFLSKPYDRSSDASNESAIVDQNAVDVCWV